MIAEVDDILIPIAWGIGISLLMTMVLYIIALVFEVQMSAKSAVYAIILFIAMFITSSSVVSGICVHSYLSEAEDAVETQIPGGIDSVSMQEMKGYILQLHPKLSSLISGVHAEDESTISGKQYLDTLYSETTKYILTKTAYFVGTILIFGVLSFLFAQRRMDYGSRRRQRRGGITNNRTRRTRH